MSEGMRLQLYLARCGIAARRQCADLIAAGRVSINGKPELRPWLPVETGDQVYFDGRPLHPARRFEYYALHKPRGMLTSASDPQGRPLADTLVKQVSNNRLFHVGRLDFMSSGLIFYSNDGNFARIVTSAACAIEKEYLIVTRRRIDESLLRRFKRGVALDGERLSIASYRLIGDRKVLIRLTEGKNREIRRLFNYHNLELKRLHRLRIGPVHLKGMAPGAVKKLNKRDVDYFLAIDKKKVLG